MYYVNFTWNKPQFILSGPVDKHEFMAETRKLLDIVAGSLYSEKEVTLFLMLQQDLSFLW